MVDPGSVINVIKQAREKRTAPLVLELDLTEGLVETPPADPLSAVLSMRRTQMRDVLDGLRRARSDDRVRAVVVKVVGGLGLAQTQDLRDAVIAVREAGKLTVAWAETFGESGRGTVPYYLASAFEQVWVQPTGEVGLTGMALEEPFLAGALEKAGIKPQFGQRHEYKTMANTFVQKAYTPAHEESSQRLVTSLAEQITEGIAVSRNLPAERVRTLMDGGPFLASDALEHGLVDKLGYRDEVYGDLRRRFPDALLRYVARYSRSHGLARKLPSAAKQDAVALINGQGAIRLGRSGRGGPLPGQSQAMGSDTIGAALRAAVRDDRVRAIVFRVNSPGGSAVASDAIWREVQLARKAGKPVVISMGNVAASGGYYVAMGADTIVAQPGTLTGSIGVVMGKPVINGLLDRLGITLGHVAEGDHARMLSLTKEFDDSEWERINASLDAIYDDFTAKVAEGRGMTRERVHELARGRVWTGADAKENGLVDELGGLDLALDLARRKVSLPADAPVRTFPHSSPLDRLRPAESSEDRTAASARLDGWGSLSGVAARLGLPSAGPLTLPGVWEIR